MRWFLVAAFVLSAAAAARADEFLKPENWEGLKDFWTVKDGMVVGSSQHLKDGLKGNNTFLCSKTTYKDFELSFAVRLKGGTGNSGIQIRSKVVDMTKFIVAGPQADIGAGYWGSLYGERFGGMMQQAPAAEINAKLKKDDFNEYSITCVGKKVTIKVNGVVAVDKVFEKLPDEGIIAFQLHQGPPMEVTFKDIKFVNLTK